jgi:hypothetical protein
MNQEWPLLLVKVATHPNVNDHVKDEYNIIARLCSSASPQVRKRIVWTGRPFWVRIVRSGVEANVLAVAQQASS